MTKDRFEKLQDMLDTEFEETLDDLIEVEFNEPILSEEVRALYKKQHPKSLDGHIYYPNLLRLQGEMIKLQDWIVATNAKVLILCEEVIECFLELCIQHVLELFEPVLCHFPCPCMSASHRRVPIC